MEQNVNSAYRVLAISKKLLKENENAEMKDAWAKVFGVKGINDLELSFKVIEKLNLLKAELDNAHYQMKNIPLEKNTYDKVFSSIQNLLTPQSLFNRLSNLKTYLSPEIINLLTICSQLLPHEEDIINEVELNEIENEINALEQKIKEKEFSEQVKNYILSQIDLIRKAITNYHIIGVKAFNYAYYEAHTVLFRELENLNTDEGKKAVKSVALVWQKLKDIAVRVNKVSNFLSSSLKLIEMGSGLFDKIKDTLNN